MLEFFFAEPLSEKEIFSLFDEQIIKQQQIHWDKNNQSVTAREVIMLGELILKQKPFKAETHQIQEAMLEGIRQMGIPRLPWNKELRQWQARVQLLRHYEIGKTLPDISDQALESTLENWIMLWLDHIRDWISLERLDLKSALNTQLDWQQQNLLDHCCPVFMQVPSGSKIQIEYRLGEQPILAVRLQELFGLKENPTIMKGQLPLMLHLLSPARRPVQITQDLESFWINTYPEVKKELMGRYPKHHWPEDPMLARATNKTKSFSRKR